jgi:AcrR family transcriptional regulator
MGRKSLKTTRQKEIIKAFYKVARKEGLENASIAKTAGVMNINPSLILHYFQTKEQLVYGLIEYIMDKYLLIYKVSPEQEDNPLKILLTVIDNIFSKKWNSLFDDGVSYGCYSLTFRDKKIKRKYKALLDMLRKKLEELITNCANLNVVSTKDPRLAADLIFVLVDGAYYYLSLVEDNKEYEHKLKVYKQQAIRLLQLNERTSFALSQ